MRVRQLVARVLRDCRLRRLATMHVLFIATEYGVWIAILVYAYRRGGPTEAGEVALLQLLPAALLAPVFATIADRHAPTRYLGAGLVVQAAGLTAMAMALAADRAPIVYAAAVVTALGIATTRPAEATLVPALARDDTDLTAANAALSWADSMGIVVGSGISGVLLGSAGPIAVALAGVVATLLAASLVVALPSLPLTGNAAGPDTRGRLAAAVRLLAAMPAPRVLVTIIAVDWLVVGALDILLVALALSVLRAQPEWVGYLNTAYGVGGVLAGWVCARLVGRRLGPPIVLAALVSGAALAVTAAGRATVTTASLLLVAGAGRAVLDMAARTLLQRAVPAEVVGTIFGVLEGVTTAALALGAVLAPALVHLAGTSGALLLVAGLMLLVVLLGCRRLWSIDEAASVPVVQIALLRCLPPFARLPAPAVTRLACSLSRLDLAAGTVIARQGESAEHYFVIAAGEVELTIDGESRGRRVRGEGVGEAALRGGRPRTATVTACGDVTLYRLPKQRFLDAVGRSGPPALAALSVSGSG